MIQNRTTSHFRIGAPSLVYGFDLLKNINSLCRMVDHIEIVVFDTPEGDNLPTREELAVLEKMQAETGLTFSVHLPASYEIASADDRTRVTSLKKTIDMIHYFRRLNPTGYILHIPLTTPTLVAEPGCYIQKEHQDNYRDWSQRAVEGLNRIQHDTGLARQLLVENINYSPTFLEPFWQQRLCGFCLDIGHLMLGGESGLQYIDRYFAVIDEIHLHGVVGWEEHLSLNVLPNKRVRTWLDRLTTGTFHGIVNLEVFSPEDLSSSLELLWGLEGSTQKSVRERFR